MIDERYTFEDYIRDFELDYLGFAGVPDGPVPDPDPFLSQTHSKESVQDDREFPG